MQGTNVGASIDGLATAQYITWAFVVLGWIWNESRNRDRENRKETRSQIDALTKSIDDLSEQGMSYYTTDISEDTSKVEAQIKVKIRRLLFAANVISSKLKISLEKEISRFEESLTGGTFESSDRVPELYSSDKVMLIGLNANLLISQVEHGFSRRYLRPWYKRLCD